MARLYDSVGYRIRCVTKTGHMYIGKLMTVDNMNILMVRVLVRYQNGSKCRLPYRHIRGSNIKSLILKDKLFYTPPS